MTYTGMSYECEIGVSDAGHSESGDMEDGVILDVSSFSFHVFSLLLYFFGSRRTINGVGTSVYHLPR